LAVLAGDYRLSIERMHPGITYALSLIRDQGAADEDSVTFHDTVAGMLKASEETFPAIEYFRDAALKTGEASRSLRRVNGRIASSLNQILDTRRIFDVWRNLL